MKILNLIQNYSWRRFIVGLPTNALNKIFMTLYSEVDIEDYYDSVARALIKKKGSGKFPNENEIISSLKEKDLYNIQPKNKNYMFEKLENYNNREFVDTSNVDITIEHIFPQNPDDQWKEDLNDNDYQIFKDKNLNTIANLTLSGNNGALSNFSFDKKKHMNNNGEEQGYIYSRLWLNNYLKTIDVWNLENYSQRFEMISKRFKSIWPFPDIEIPESEGVEVNIFDAENPTNKQLDYFIFEDTKIEEPVLAKMYSYVLEKLYEKNPEFFLSLEEFLKVSRDQKEFRAAKHLINGYYVESNLSSNAKFIVLKKLLQAFDLEDDLRIKFDDEESAINSHVLRRKFWNYILPKIKGTSLFENNKATREYWIGCGSGKSGITYNMLITRDYVGLELVIATSDKSKNIHYFNEILKNKEVVENSFGEKLIWHELPEYKMSSISAKLDNVSLYNEEDWDIMTKFLLTNLPKFEQGLKPEIDKLKS